MTESITDARSPAFTPGIPRPPNIQALTSIRFFAALHVALYHLVRPFTLWGPLTPVIRVGHVAVGFFFVLSGFILTYSHAEEFEQGKGRPAKFWIARLARIYPVYLLVLLFAGYFYRSAFLHPIHTLAYIADLLMLQSWSVRMVGFFNVPAWSLSCEAFFYFVFPFLLLRLRPSSAAKAVAGFVGFCLLALVAPAIMLWVYPELSWHEGVSSANSWKVFLVRRLPFLALPEFLAGVSLGWFYLRYGISRRTASGFATGSVLLLAIVFALSDHVPFMLLNLGLLIPLFAMLILALCQPNWLSRPLSHPVLVLLGEASFALYLTHFLFNDWTIATFHWGGTLHECVWKLAIVIPLSIGLHLGVERPCRRWILRWWRQGHPIDLAMAGK